MGFLDKVNAAKPKNKAKVLSKSATRILSLPRLDHPPIDTTPWELPNCTIDLRMIQRKALSAIYTNGGAFFPIGVGWGKTFIALLAPIVRGKKHAILIAPSATIDNLMEELSTIELNFKHDTTFTFMSYGELSKTDSSDILERISLEAPEDTMLICDEAHKLKRMESARTKRVLRYLKNNRAVEVVMLSGTMTNRTLKDYAHLTGMTLREKTPMPLARRELENWCEVIDVEGKCEQHNFIDCADVLKRYDPTLSSHDPISKRKEKARRAFAIHLRGALGVVGTVESALGTSLMIHQIRKLNSFSKDLKEIYNLVKDGGDSPDGEITYESPADLGRALAQISLGFFYKWKWPEGKIDLEWMEARSTWNRLVRNELAYKSKEGYDTEKLIWNAVGSSFPGGVTPTSECTELQNAWCAWRNERVKDPPPIETVWLDDSTISWAIAYARNQRGCSIWYQSKAVANRLEELGLKEVFRSGDKIPTKSLPDIAAFSVSSHGTGLNLQKYNTALVLEPPSSGLRWEQLLGRLHRPGQLADEVNFHVLQHTPKFRGSLRNALEDSKYIQDSTQQPQKLMFAVKTKREG